MKYVGAHPGVHILGRNIVSISKPQSVQRVGPCENCGSQSQFLHKATLWFVSCNEKVQPNKQSKKMKSRPVQNHTGTLLI